MKAQLFLEDLEHNIENHTSSSNNLESDDVEMPLPTAVVVAELVILGCNGAYIGSDAKSYVCPPRP